MKNLLAVVLLCGLSFDLAATDLKVQGDLIFAQGGSVHVLNLQTLEDRRVPGVELGGPIPLTAFHSRRVLGSLNGMFELDIDTGALRRLGPGHQPSYFPEEDVLFFTRGVGSAKRQHLFRSKPDGIADSEREVSADVPPSGAVVIRISKDEVVFPTADRDGFIHADLLVNSTRRIKSACLPLGWQRTKQKLVCWNAARGTIFLSDLRGRNVVPVANPPRASPVLYVEDVDYLFFNVPASGLLLPERRDLYAMHLASGRSVKLAEGVALAFGHAAFVRRE